MRKYFLGSFLGSFLFLFWPKSAFAFTTCTPSSGGDGIETGIGCMAIDINNFVASLLPVLFGISGGIAFLLMVYGFIMVAVSGGDEKKLQGAKETISSAITGLLVSIFALFILRLVAVGILHIPGF